MAGVNKVILIGRLGADPELKSLPDGTAVTKISIATSETWKDKTTGDKKEITEWHRVTLWRKLAEIAAQYLAKGSQVYIEGKLQTRSWEDKNGEKRYMTDIVAANMQMLGSKSGGGGHSEHFGDPPPVSSSQDDDDIPF